MTDSVEKIAADLTKYLRREQELGTSLYFNEGIINKEPEADQDPFIADCSDFVAKAITQITPSTAAELSLEEKTTQLAELNKQVAACEQCKLAPGRTNL